MKQKFSILIRGKEKLWGFPFEGDPKHLPDWEADGLQVHEVLNRIPVWAQQLGLSYLWVRVQDAWRLDRLW